MRSSRRCAHHARGHRLATVENLNVNPVRRHTHGRERLSHVRHEPIWSTQINIRVAGYADGVEDCSRQMTGSIEVFTHLVARARPAVTDIAPSIRECTHEILDLDSERMMLPVASRVEPQDLPWRAVRG